MVFISHHDLQGLSQNYYVDKEKKKRKFEWTGVLEFLLISSWIGLGEGGIGQGFGL